MKRKIITIDEEKCTGCGLCIPNCPEGALKIVNGKATLAGDILCDGLGACLGHCPEGAISIEERESEEYNERTVMKNVVAGGAAVIKSHLEHLHEHQQTEYFNQAVAFLKEKHIPVPAINETHSVQEPHQGCPGTRMMDFSKKELKKDDAGPAVALSSELEQWPIQLQLLNPSAPYFKNAELVIAADCVPFACANFHQQFLKGKKLIIFCPKLDHVGQMYVDKLSEIFKHNSIKSITIVHMEVPCCFGVGTAVQAALKKAECIIPIADVTISLQGEIKK